MAAGESGTSVRTVTGSVSGSAAPVAVAAGEDDHVLVL